jgi:peptide/nickel transport system permease protein
VVVLIGVSLPQFWSGLLVILAFGLYLGWFPIGGALSVGLSVPRVTGMYVVDSLLAGNWSACLDALQHLVLPAFTLGLGPAAIITRQMRSAMLEVLRQDYVTTARSKGLRERVVVLRHVVRNSLIPVVTVMGLQIGQLLSGAVVVETIFARPGIGRLAILSIGYRDYPVVQGIVLVAVLVFVFVNLMVDVLYALLDPKIRYA